MGAKKKDDLSSVRHQLIDALLRLWRVKFGKIPTEIIAAHRGAFDRYRRSIFTELRCGKTMAASRAAKWRKLPGCADVDFVSLIDRRTRDCDEAGVIERTKRQIARLKRDCDKFEKTPAGAKNVAAAKTAVAALRQRKSHSTNVSPKPVSTAESRAPAEFGPTKEELRANETETVTAETLSTIRQQAAGALLLVYGSRGSRLGNITSVALETLTGIPQARWVMVLGGGDSGLNDAEIDQISRKLKIGSSLVPIAVLRPLTEWSRSWRSTSLGDMKGLIVDWRTATIRAREEEAALEI